MIDSYAKCNYAEGMFSSEYLITFKGCNDPLGGVFVNKEDVIPLDEIYGLVKLKYFKKEGAKSKIGINDVGNHRVSSFTVPTRNTLEIECESNLN